MTCGFLEWKNGFILLYYHIHLLLIRFTIVVGCSKHNFVVLCDNENKYSDSDSGSR